ncbi:hypothetical protein [Phytohabitans aurantiacus]|uniref:Uncharacterized protein n=1 Tax=Phytohabitans aurantiacus TaxID=3016789 RepID=A0ABQ5QPY8_9ACTN|nr:hypothetical protein [Phytohabitans aurantiacus]GLH96715.1 hypothetical protein Pa4123_19890 [Phytohabitans aurantiacus]
MTLDERVIKVLGDMADDLTPEPDPYDRVRARWRRRRRQRTAAASVGLVALVAAGAMTAVRVQGDNAPNLADESDSNWTHVQAWSERLYESPPRGGLAGDKMYLQALASAVAQQQPAGKYREVRVLFLDDIGPYRIALVALARTAPTPNFWTHASRWLVADRGATVDKLAADATRVGDALEPYVEMELSKGDAGAPVVQIALAAGDCDFESAPWPAVKDWQPEATGSYLARAPQDAKPEWWRVTCDGVMREEGPAPGWLAPEGITEAEYATALSGIRGVRDPVSARDEVMSANGHWGYEVTGLPKVIWQGRISGAGEDANGQMYDGTGTMAAAPAVGGGWRGELSIRYDAIDPVSNGVGSSVSFGTRTDPGDPSSVVVVRLHDTATLVVTPANANGVEVVRGDTVVAQVPAKDAAALLSIGVKPGDVVRARDAAGAVVGTVTVDDDPLPGVSASRWHLE